MGKSYHVFPANATGEKRKMRRRMTKPGTGILKTANCPFCGQKKEAFSVERIKRSTRRGSRSARLYWRAAALTALGMALIVLGFFAAAYFTGALR